MAEAEKDKPRQSSQLEPARKPDEDPVGKVYDSRLMRRLAHYLRPYWLQATISAIAVTLKSLGDVAGPFLVMVGIDHYFPQNRASNDVSSATHWLSSANWLTNRLSPDPMQRHHATGRDFPGDPDFVVPVRSSSRPT